MCVFSPQLNSNVKPLAKPSLAAGIYSFAMDVTEIRLRNLKRLETDLRAKFKTQKSVAVQLDMSPSFLSQLIGGKKMGDEVARKIEDAQNLPHGYMDTPQWNKSRPPVQAYDIEAVDGMDGVDFAKEVLVPEVDAMLSAGDGQSVEFVETKYRLPYQIEWLRKVGVMKTEDVKLMPVHGSSMERTVFDGDKVLIHLTQTKIVSDAVFAIMLDGEPKIKRLFNTGAGVRIVSDNEDKVKYPDDLVTPEQAERLIVLGRAIHRQGSKGL